MTDWAGRLHAGIALLNPREFALALARCPYCGPSVFVRLRRDETGVRCTHCAASAVHLALGWVLRDRMERLGDCDACELSARGPLVAFLRRSARSLATSEYFADVAPGTSRDGVRCEDIQRLTYADESFDLVTHTEVFEHVADDARAFAELARVLRAGGATVFTVPMHAGECTTERARLRDGVIEHLHAPVYHTDPLRAGAGILVFRDYGYDILDRLRGAGFAEAVLVTPVQRIPWIVPRAVVVARKPA